MESLESIRVGVRDRLAAIPSIERLVAGDLDRDAYRRYLICAYHYARFSPRVISLAGSRCADDHAALAAYLFEHAREELGHEHWALADLRDLGMRADEVQAANPTPSCWALIGYVHFVAAYDNPLGLFGWLYTLEAAGNDVGTFLGDKLRAALGDAGSAVRFVANHGESDVGHTRAIAAKIDEHIVRAEDRAAVERVATLVAEFYVRMFREIDGTVA